MFVNWNDTKFGETGIESGFDALGQRSNNYIHCTEVPNEIRPTRVSLIQSTIDNVSFSEDKISYRNIYLGGDSFAINPLGFHPGNDHFIGNWIHTVGRVIKYVVPFLGLMTVCEGADLLYTTFSNQAVCYKRHSEFYKKNDEDSYVEVIFSGNVQIQIADESKKEIIARGITLIVRGIFETFMLGWVFLPLDCIYEIVRVCTGPKLNEISIKRQEVEAEFPGIKVGGNTKNARSGTVAEDS